LLTATAAKCLPEDRFEDITDIAEVAACWNAAWP